MTPRPPDTPPAGDFGPALHLAREGRFAEAVAWVRAAVTERGGGEAVSKTAAAALSRIAQLAQGAERLREAEQAVEVGLGYQPKFPDLQVQRARLLLAHGQRVEARRALESALRVNPRYVAARVELALLDARDGLIGEALDSLRAVARDGRVAESSEFERALDHLREADIAAAGRCLSRAFQLSEPEVDERVEQARRRLEEGAPEEAARIVREMLPGRGQFPDLHMLLGAAELQLGRPDDALASLARALELHPDFHGARVQLACALHALGSTVQAVEQLQLVLEADPGHADALALYQRWTSRPIERSRAHDVTDS